VRELVSRQVVLAEVREWFDQRGIDGENLLAVLEQIPSESGWISVEERLPENDQMVIFIPNYYAKSIRVGTLSQVGERGGVMFDDKYVRNAMNYYARYWMPLPEPPKEENKNDRE
jgi:hypothetical protein